MWTLRMTSLMVAHRWRRCSPPCRPDDAPRVMRAFDLFEAAHPRETPHYYLSLLGTDPARRGHGYGLSLLAANLRLVDAAGAPAYLETSNPANVTLYEHQPRQFEDVGRATP